MDTAKPHPIRQAPTPTGAPPLGAASRASRVEAFIAWLEENREIVESPEKGAITFSFSSRVFSVELKQNFTNST